MPTPTRCLDRWWWGSRPIVDRGCGPWWRPATGCSRSTRCRHRGSGNPITRQSGKQKFVLARYVHNDRLLDALGRQAFTALTASPAARAYYDQLTTRGKDHNAAVRQLANRLVGTLHGCLKTNTPYDETTAWPAFHQDVA
jgi:hypothetical protein